MHYVGGYELPDNVVYCVQSGIWLRRERDDHLTLGMAAFGLRRLGLVQRFVPRRIGQRLRRGMSCGTVESIDWVEPARCPIKAELVAVNPEVVADPQLMNRSPYADGWLVRLRPEESLAGVPDLLEAAEAALVLQELCRRERQAEGLTA